MEEDSGGNRAQQGKSTRSHVGCNSHFTSHLHIISKGARDGEGAIIEEWRSVIWDFVTKYLEEDII